MTRKNNRCYRGHEMTLANTQPMRTGFTSCKECNRLLWRNYYHRRLAKKPVVGYIDGPHKEPD